MIVESFAAGPLQCNCTVIGCEITREAIVCDPGGDVDEIIRRLDEANLTLKAIIHTHAHFDHILGTRELQEKAGGEILLHPGAQPLYTNIRMQLEAFGIPLPVEDTRPVDTELEDNQTLAFGEHHCLVMHTPGHTPGSCCFTLRGKTASGNAEMQLLLAGDTLFRRGVGRTDLWGGSRRTLEKSIRDRLYTLDDDTRVIPGHGPETRIGEERRSNPFVTAG